MALFARKLLGVSCTALAAHNVPRLETFKVIGLLPSNERLQVDFNPPFVKENTSAKDFFCTLDNAMEHYSLVVEARLPALLSRLDADGHPIASRSSLEHQSLAPGARVVYDVDVTDGPTSRYTLVVERRLGTSLELLGLRPVTARNGSFTVPFHAGELQSHFEAEQSFNEDTFTVEYDYADGGQAIDCRIDSSRSIGPDAPSKGDLLLHPHRLTPSLESSGRPKIEHAYNPRSPGAGPTSRCSVPIDTWRRVQIGLYIVAADKVSHRHINITVTRKGCRPDTFYHKGSCVNHCPTFYYPQTFNWRCGACQRHCEFCEHWRHCIGCRRNTTTYRYALASDGSCTRLRVHPFEVYYYLASVLGIACASLTCLYVLICVVVICRRSLRRDDDTGKRLAGRSQTGSSEERQPLTGSMSRHENAGSRTFPAAAE